MGKPLFSIIIPVYNAQNYIRKAVESVRNQTFGEWELLLVSDCPEDASNLICREYSSRDERIRLIKLDENRGAGYARNMGIAAAEGTYITFMDADDYIADTMLEVVYRVLRSHPAKLTVLGILKEYFDQEGKISATERFLPVKKGEPEALTFDEGSHGESLTVLFLRGQKEVRDRIISLEQNTLYGYVCNKFYEAAYLKHLKLEMADMPLLEDARFNIQYVTDIDSMNLVNIAPYHYCKRNSGRLKEKNLVNYYEIHRAHIDMLFSQQIGWDHADAKTRKILGGSFAKYMFAAMERNCGRENGLDHAQRKQWMKAVFSDYLFAELIPFGRGNGMRDSLMLFILKTKSVPLNLAAGRIRYLFRKKLPGLFIKEKQKN